MDYNNIKYFNTIKTFLCNIVTLQESATFKLLTASILVSISGIFRVYICYMFRQVDPNLSMCLACSLVIYSIYTIDRTFGSKEDSVNRSNLMNSNKSIGVFFSVLAFVIGLYFYLINGLLLIALLPVAVCYLYSKGLKLGNQAFKLKSGHGIKNLVLGSTWGLFIVGSAGVTDPVLFTFLFILYGVKVFRNSIMNDLKDIKGDTLAGIKTVPVILGQLKTRNFLLIHHFIVHLVLASMMFYGLVQFEPVVVLCSYVCELICILNYQKSQNVVSKIFREGESTMTVLLRSASMIPV